MDEKSREYGMSETENTEILKPIYHYTDQKGLLGVIKNAELWATSIVHLNDATENNLMFNSLLQEASARLESLNEPIKEIFESTIVKMLLQLKNLYQNDHSCFVTSFSPDPDKLSQWRGYCTNGQGYSIGFNQHFLKEQLQQNEISNKLVPCRYLNESEIKAEIDKFVEIINRTPPIGTTFPLDHELRDNFAWLIELAPVLKHPGFIEENEMRAGFFVDLATEEKIEFREGKFGITPYIKIQLLEDRDRMNDLIKDVYVGPSPTQHLAIETLKLFLQLNGIDPEKAKKSEIPYR